MLSPTKRQHENNQLYYYMSEIIMDQINMLPCGTPLVVVILIDLEVEPPHTYVPHVSCSHIENM